MPHDVRFVVESEREEVSSDLNDAYKITAKSDNASWISYDEILDLVNFDAGTTFVCGKFEGPAFEELKRRHLRILGPRYVIYCNQKGELTERLDSPALTATMKGVVVCCTNVPRERRLRLHDKVKLMGGRITKAFTEEATHLVANQASSKKYHLAVALKRPVYTSEWIDHCWHDGKSEFVHATDARYKEFLCPIFKGLSVTVSQISVTERKKIKDSIENNGGHYAGCLKVNVTTHLVLHDSTGDKFKMAKNKNIYCVKPSWVFDSIEKGYCADEQHYSLEEENNAPVSTSKYCRDQLTNLSSSSTTNTTERTVNETVLSTSKFERMCNAEDEQLLFDSNKLAAAGQFLDGCKIVISGFTPLTVENLKKVLNKGGATRFDQINEHVTHVIMGKQTDEHMKILLAGNYRPHVVSLSWLRESINTGKLLDECKFQCLDLPAVNQVSPVKKQKPKVSPSSSQTSLQIELVKADDFDDVLSQYLPDNTIRKVDEKFIFDGLTFAVLGFDNKDKTVLQQFITELGGVIINDQNIEIQAKTVVDYAVVPLCRSVIPVKSIHTVTYFWLQSCMDDKRIHDLTSHALYVPIEFNIELKPLNGCVVVTSQYESPERETIINLAELLGAKYQDRLSRVNQFNQDLLANTHLITEEANGKKYSAATAWGIPVVSNQWLIDCAKAGNKLDEANYLIGKSKDLDLSKPGGFHTSTPIRTPKRMEEHPRVSIVEKSDMLAGPSSQTPLRDVFKTPVMIRKDSVTEEEMNKIKERIATGYKTPVLSNTTVQKLLSEESVTNNSTSSCATPDSSTSPTKLRPLIRLRDAMAAYDSPVNVPSKPKINESEVAKMFLRGVDKALKDHMDQYGCVIPDRKLSIGDFEDSPKPLRGLVVVVSKRLENYQSELYKLAESLGAKCRWSYDKKATHLIHEGKDGGHFSKEARDALADGKFVISREWLYACRDRNIRVEEADYPYTYHSRMALDVTKKVSSKPRNRLMSDECPKSPLAKPEAPSSKLDSEMNKLIDAAKVYKQKQNIKTPTNLTASFFKEGNKKPPPKPRKGSEPEVITNFESVPVTWANHLGYEMNASTSAGSKLNDESAMIDISHVDKISPKILIASVTTQEKRDYYKLVKRLGGKISFEKDFDSTFTHLVTGQPNFTEKFIASVAKGLWVLKKSYLEACSQVGYFVEEEEHEWGRNPNEEGDPGSKEYKLAVAAHRWRVQVDDMRKTQNCMEPYGAFSKWKVIVYTDETRAVSFKRILSAGGAEIIPASPPFSDVEGVTHAFMEMSKVPDSNVDFSSLVHKNVLCLKFEFITAFLVDYNDPDEFYIPEVIHLIPKSKQSSIGKRFGECDSSASKKPRNNF